MPPGGYGVVGVVDDEDFVVGTHGASLGFDLDVVGVVPARVETGAADLKEP
jgi:hypothetical protein